MPFPIPHITRRPVRAQTGVYKAQKQGAQKGGGWAHNGMPPPPLPPVRATPFAQKGGARGHASGPLPFPTSRRPIHVEGRRTGTPPPLLPVAPGAHEGTHHRPPSPRRPRPLPFPFGRAAVREGTPPPPFPVRVGTPPPLTVAPGPSPSPVTAPPRHATRPLLFPRDRPAPYAREGALEGTRSPAPLFPMRAEGHTTHGKGAREGTRSPAPPFPRDRPAPYAREGGMRGAPPPPPWPPRTRGKGHARARDHRPHPSTMHAEGHTTHGKGAREGTQPPGPPFPRDRTIPYAREWGTRGAPPPPLPLGLPPLPFPRDRPTPYAREGRARDHGPTLPPCARRGTPRTGRVHVRARDPRPIPSPVTAPPRMRGKGVRRGTPPRSHPSAFGGKRTPLARRPVYATPAPPFRAVRHTRKGAREGKPPPAGGPVRAGRGPPPHVSRSGAGAVSVHPRSLRPRRDFRAPWYDLVKKKWM
ncbi:hypothetical protein EDB89DRAFT_2084157 [Lactarius sanguifluus]|nr:hypothetical protein EDB89DRAFT_2084157 [Lactarius sanguifluus]